MSTDVTELRDHAEISSTLNAMAWCQDRRTWDGLDNVLADRVAIQYAGQEEPATVDRANLVSSWRAPLEAIPRMVRIMVGDRTPANPVRCDYALQGGPGETRQARTAACGDAGAPDAAAVSAGIMRFG